MFTCTVSNFVKIINTRWLAPTIRLYNYFQFGYCWDTPVHFGNTFCKSCENAILMPVIVQQLFYYAYKVSESFHLLCHSSWKRHRRLISRVCRQPSPRRRSRTIFSMKYVFLYSFKLCKDHKLSLACSYYTSPQLFLVWILLGLYTCSHWQHIFQILGKRNFDACDLSKTILLCLQVIRKLSFTLS